MSRKKIILTGGGTGGHIYPLVEISRVLIDKYDLMYIGLGTDFEKKAFSQVKLSHQSIFAGKFRRNIGFTSFILNIIDIIKLVIGILQSIFIVIKFKPSMVFSKGGYVALPVCAAAKIMGVKLIIHESDVSFGLANKIAAKFAKRILVGFPVDAYLPKYASRAIRVGVPVKQSFFATTCAVKKNIILIVGGSSGAVSLNQLIFSIGEKLLKKYKIVHLVGGNNLRDALEFRESLDIDIRKKYTPIAYSNEVDELVRKSDLVISRSGATAIFEVLANHKPLILVPISPVVASHQLANAMYCQNEQVAKMVLPSENTLKLPVIIDKLLSGEAGLCKTNFVLKNSSSKIKQIIDSELDNYLDNYHSVHLIGSGGVSMKSVGKILSGLGKKVTGSDLKFGGHSPENITKNIDLVVYSSAASAGSPAKVEHDQAHRLKIEIIKRSKMIAIIAQNKSIISVAGMHGKTTTSSIISQIFLRAGYDPSFLIGAQSTKLNPTARFSARGEHIVLEACEYDGSFLDFNSEAAVITNIELEHLDYFRNGIKGIMNAFNAFILNINDGGVLVYCIDNKNLKQLVEKNKKQLLDRSIRIISYGHDKEADFVLSKVNFENNWSKFWVKNGKNSTLIESPIPGDHFALNCTGAFALSRYFGIDELCILSSIKAFYGADRRFSYVDSYANVKLYDDYAHHPTEIKSTLNALREANKNENIAVVFQPHQQKRFDDFYGNFLDVFVKSDINLVILLPVFKIAGRDSKEIKSSKDLVNDLVKRGKKVFYADNYHIAEKLLMDNCTKEKYIVMTMGATDVYKIGNKFLEDARIEKKFNNSI
jgi:UDP-N-acetylmuramate--alanine ligase